MNKIESILWMSALGIPTRPIYLIDKENIEEQVESVYSECPFGWAIRSGEKPSPDFDSPADTMTMPWTQTGKLSYTFTPEDQKAQLKYKILEIYSKLSPNQTALIHKQREFWKSGILVIDKYCRLEAIAGWPFGLEQGTDNPNVSYTFDFGSWNRPNSVAGDPYFLNPHELFQIWELERKIDYSILNSLKSVVNVSFAFEVMTGGIRGIDVFDIRCGISSKYENLRDKIQAPS